MRMIDFVGIIRGEMDKRRENDLVRMMNRLFEKVLLEDVMTDTVCDELVGIGRKKSSGDKKREEMRDVLRARIEAIKVQDGKKSHVSGFSLYRSECKGKGMSVQKVSEVWKSLGDEGQSRYNDEARRRREMSNEGSISVCKISERDLSDTVGSTSKPPLARVSFSKRIESEVNLGEKESSSFEVLSKGKDGKNKGVAKKVVVSKQVVKPVPTKQTVKKTVKRVSSVA